MNRGRGYYNPGNDSFGTNLRRNNDQWYGPNNTGGRNDNYGYKGQGQGRNFTNSANRSRFGDQNKEYNSTVCKHFALFDNCRFGNKCSFLHTIKRVLHMQDVCRGGVYCSTVCMTKDNGLELYASGLGPTVKRFKFYSNNSNEIQTANCPNINIQMPIVSAQQNQSGRGRGKGYPSDQNIHSLLFMDDCLFVGLRTGHICIHHLPSGNSTMLEGHDSPVNCIIVIEGVVLSVCESGKINLWKFDANSGVFNCVNTLLTKSTVTCLLEVNCDITSPVSTNQPPRILWTGGSVINIIDLSSLSMVKTIQLPNNVSVKCFMRYGNHVIVGFTNGYVKVFTGVGDEVFMTEAEGNSITAMDGMQTTEGDVLLMGNRTGQLSVFQLPSFNLQYLLQCLPEAHKKSGISKISPLGTQHFLTTGYDGNVSVFMWNLV